MRQQPNHISWKITCRSSDDVQVLQQWLSSHIDLERVLEDTACILPDGVEQVQIVQHRLGDYFESILILPESPANTASFQLVFRRRPDAGGFWKDLMVNILQEIESTPQTASIKLGPKSRNVVAPSHSIPKT